jgi:hypothetical protein
MKSPDITSWETLLPANENLALLSAHPYATWLSILQVSREAREGRLPDSETVLRVIQEWPDKETILRWKANAYDLRVFGEMIHTEEITPAESEMPEIAEEENHEVATETAEPIIVRAHHGQETEMPVLSIRELYVLGFVFDPVLKSSSQALSENKNLKPETENSIGETTIGQTVWVQETATQPESHESSEEQMAADLIKEENGTENIGLPDEFESQQTDEADPSFDFTFFIFALTSQSENPDNLSAMTTETENDDTAFEKEAEHPESESASSDAEEQQDNVKPLPGETFTSWLKRINGGTSDMEEAHSEKKRSKKSKESSEDEEEEKRAKAARKLLKKAKKAQKKAKKKLKKSQDPVESIIQESVRFTPAVVTETYAELLVRQGYADKAKEMYRELMLRNPEKSSYFAGKIKELN